MNATNLMAVSSSGNSVKSVGIQTGKNISETLRSDTADRNTSGKNTFDDALGSLNEKQPAAPAVNTKSDAAETATDTAVIADEEININVKDSKPADEMGASSAADEAADNNPAVETEAAAALTTAALAQLFRFMNFEPSDSVLTVDNPEQQDILERYGISATALADENVSAMFQSLLPKDNAVLTSDKKLLAQLAGEIVPMAKSEAEMMPVSAVLPDSKEPAAVNTVAAKVANTPVTGVNDEAQTNTGVLNAAIISVGDNEVSPINNAAANANINQLGLKVSVNNARSSEADTNGLDVLAQRTIRRELMGEPNDEQDFEQNLSEEKNSDAYAQQKLNVTDNLARNRADHNIANNISSQAETGFAERLNAADGVINSRDTSAATDRPAETPAGTRNIQAQIVEQARLLRTQTDTQMVIRLRPEHLGDLTLRVTVGGDGAVTASFHSDNAQVRNTIENTLVQLRQELNNQGIKVDKVEVFSGLADGQLPQGQGQQAWGEANSGANQQLKSFVSGDAEDYAEGALMVGDNGVSTMGGGTITTDGVDYRI